MLMLWIWVAVIVLSIIIEVFTMEIVSIWLTFGAIIPLILAATGKVNWLIQLVVFFVVSTVLIVSLRKVTKKFLLKNATEKTNLNALIGQKFRMLERTDFETIGSIKINGVVWAAVGLDRQTIEKDDIVEIVNVSGNKMVVKKVDEVVVPMQETEEPAKKSKSKEEKK